MLVNILAPSLVRRWQGQAGQEVTANPVTDILPTAGGFYALTRAGGFGLMRFEVTGGALAPVQTLAVTGQPQAGQLPQIHALEGRILLTGLPAGGQLHTLAQNGAIGAGVTLATTLRGGELTDFVSPTKGFAYGLDAAGRNILRYGVDASGTFSTPQSLLPPVIGTRPADFVLRDLLRVGDILIGAGAGQDALVTWRIAANGNLSAVAMVKAADLGSSGAIAVAAVTLAGQDYLVLLGTGSSSLDILRLGADGRVAAVDHVIDSGGTRFYQPGLLASASDGTRAFVAVAGRDAGFSLFQILPDGRLVHLFTDADALAGAGGTLSALALDLQGNSLRVIGAGGVGTTVASLEFTLPAAGVILQAQAAGQSLQGGSAADVLIGAAGNDTLVGGAGADILIDGAGQDRLTGGAGADLFILDADGARDVITDFTPGDDLIDLSSWTRLRGLSQLGFSESGGVVTITYANETLEVHGAGGRALTLADILAAGLVGLDRLRPDWAAAAEAGGVGYTPDNGLVLDPRYQIVPPPLPTPEPAPVEPPAPPEPLAGEVMQEGNGTLYGSEGPDLLVGGAGRDLLLGGGGADRLDGRGGADWLRGGAGDDIYFVDDSGDSITEYAGEGHDTVYSAVSFSLAGQELEDLYLTGTAPLWGTGNAGPNRITGNGAANRLDGGGGGDVLAGGGGDDLYIVRDSRDSVLETAGGGRDTVWAHVSFTLPAETERLFLKGAAAIDATGNALSNEIVGNAAANWLNGKAGTDYLRGNGGRDVFVLDQPAGAQHADYIKDFIPGEDRIALAASVFGLKAGSLAARDFALDAATTAQTRFIYARDTGWLSFDPDGTGSAPAQPLARLLNLPELGAGDLFLI